MNEEKIEILSWFDPVENNVVTRLVMQGADASKAIKEIDYQFKQLLRFSECAALGLKPEGSTNDMFIVINYLQQVLNSRLSVKRKEFIPCALRHEIYSEEKVVEWTLNWSRALQQELSELIDSCPWKWWKDMEFDKQNAKVEAVDMLHFLVSLFQTLGMSPQDVTQAYIKKNLVNHQRQAKEGGYTAQNKDPEDSRHI